MHFQCVKQAESHTINKRPTKGVDVFLTVDGGLRSVRGVSENAVRCILGRDYDYFFNRNVNRDGYDLSRQCSETELQSLKTSRA